MKIVLSQPNCVARLPHLLLEQKKFRQFFFVHNKEPEKKCLNLKITTPLSSFYNLEKWNVFCDTIFVLYIYWTCSSIPIPIVLKSFTEAERIFFLFWGLLLMWGKKKSERHYWHLRQKHYSSNQLTKSQKCCRCFSIKFSSYFHSIRTNVHPLILVYQPVDSGWQAGHQQCRINTHTQTRKKRKQYPA